MGVSLKVFVKAELYLCHKWNVYVVYFADLRSVTPVLVIATVFEYCIMKRLCTYVKFHDLQFGFTKEGGCEQALLMFKTEVEYFRNMGL